MNAERAGVGSRPAHKIMPTTIDGKNTSAVRGYEDALELTEQIRNGFSGIERLVAQGIAYGIVSDDVVDRIFHEVMNALCVTATCTCGVVLVELRADARYCSNACRQ